MSAVFELDCAGKLLNLNRTQVMGILNVTPDSFYENSRCHSLDDTLRRAEDMVEQGAAILDVGGESTSKMVPRYGDKEGGAQYVGGHCVDSNNTASVEQELERVIPVVEALSQRFDCVVSVDTSAALVMRESVSAGAGMINDIRALQRPGALVGGG